ncbi:MAG: PLP-dependent aminotransferase family protein [Dehalococcoidales bacterium]|nr:PLP-dependent aminotransferase family protein [Dehalococcoidales bacterium]
MSDLFSDRIADVPRSFIREILKVALDRSVISFAGGLPNRELFPAAELKAATDRVFEIFGTDVFQYSNSEGYSGLREWISQRYRKKKGLEIPVDNILITNGSQQGMDLLGKVLINDGDDIIIEEPGYLGAIQAFFLYRPRFNCIPLSENGLDIERLKSVMSTTSPKLIYTVPNFQNPSGISYSGSNRKAIAEIISGTSMVLIEDDPYGELRYSGTDQASFKKLLPENTILLGSFSKTVVPGFRLGWIAAPDNIMDRLLVAKQASDLHSSQFTQYIVYQYLKDNDIDKHIARIRDVYGRQAGTMLESIEKYFPPEVKSTHPEGGMFLWACLPENTSSRKLLELAVKDKVIFVPGDPFYVGRQDTNTMRLNFSCSDEETIKTGIQRLGKAINEMLR